MCIARVGRVLEADRGRATVKFFDGRTLGGVDLTVVGAKKGEFVEVFGNMALSVLTPSEAGTRKRAWAEIRRASLAAQTGD